jgi:hypothetical protein
MLSEKFINAVLLAFKGSCVPYIYFIAEACQDIEPHDQQIRGPTAVLHSTQNASVVEGANVVH